MPLVVRTPAATPSGFDDRRHLRLPVCLETAICSSSVRRLTADLVDISVTGCRIDTPIYVLPGCHLTVTVPGLAPLGATVRWCDRHAIGLEFQRSLDPRVVDHVAALSRSLADHSG